ncbi:MAG: hypothetical protein VSS75_035100, partial [Candidatus Parabeggiatoa sp.]|nr:hypothetical protein [Candidatus Parabeggiatoa sp.]
MLLTIVNGLIFFFFSVENYHQQYKRKSMLLIIILAAMMLAMGLAIIAQNLTIGGVSKNVGVSISFWIVISILMTGFGIWKSSGKLVVRIKNNKVFFVMGILFIGIFI